MSSLEIIEQVQAKRLIFTVTTGRSGTAYLAAVLGYAQGVYSVHEPFPEFADVLRPVQNNPDLARRFLLEQEVLQQVDAQELPKCSPEISGWVA